MFFTNTSLVALWNQRRAQPVVQAERAKSGAPLNFYYKGFPKKRKCLDDFLVHHFFPDHVSVLLRVSKMKMADCETTTGHVGRRARTLMKDARRGLNR